MPINLDQLWVPVTVPTGKKSLDFFMHNWKEGELQGLPFNGEILPPSGSSERKMTIAPENISHCVLDVDMNSYDEKTDTVQARVKFTGPYHQMARSMYINKDLRFIARTVTLVNKHTNERVKRIVTFDCITRPGAK